MTTTAIAPVDGLFAPLQDASVIATDKAKKLVNLQLSCLESYMSIGIGQVRAAVAINNPDDFQAFAAKQADVLARLSEKAIGDMQQVISLGSEFGSEMQKLFERCSPKQGIGGIN